MGVYEYKAVPAPQMGKRARGVKGTDGRFANALTLVINEQAQYGWEYLHAESLPAMERYGILRRKRETHQNVLIFRRQTDKAPMEQAEAAKSMSVNPFKKIVPSKERVEAPAAKPEKVEPKPAKAPAKKPAAKKSEKAD